MWRRVRYLLVLAGLCAVATCPTAQRSCRANQAERESDHLLDYLGDRVEAYVQLNGKVPPLPAGPTPVPGCCEQGGMCSPDQTMWESPGWRALQFSIDGDWRYTYEYIPDATGRAAIVRATGDLGCDGASRVDELKLELDATGKGVSRTWSHRIELPPE